MGIRQLLDRTFWKFILVGIINTFFGAGIMFLFYNIFHFGYWISSISNYFFGSILSYFLNRRFTFHSKSHMKKTLLRFIINICLCYLIAYGFAKPLTIYVLFNTTSNIQENVAMVVGMCFFVGLNYIGQRFFVFKQSEHN